MLVLTKLFVFQMHLWNVIQQKTPSVFYKKYKQYKDANIVKFKAKRPIGSGPIESDDQVSLPFISVSN